MTNSVLANLPGVTSPEAVAQAQATSNHALKTGKPITGKYLFENFVTSKTDVTKMNIIEAATQSVGTDDFDKAVKDMVEIAKNTMGEAGLKTARNHAAVLRNVYGAIKNRRDDMVAAGFEQGKTGYHVANTAAKSVLKAAAIKWDGTPAKTQAERQAARVNKAEQEAFKQAQAEMPRNEGESLSDYTVRVAARAEEISEQLLNEAQAERVKKIVEAVKKMAGDDLSAVVAALLDEATD